MALALTGFSVIAGGVLGWVNDVTAEPIAQANAKILSDAIAVVVPGFDSATSPGRGSLSKGEALAMRKTFRFYQGLPL